MNQNQPVVDLFRDITRADFLARWWQQRPHLFRQVLESAGTLVSGDELAGLACEDVVESRLIEGAGLDGPWRCTHGPLEGLNYDSLGPVNWTLLVQGVDQWVEPVRALLHQFDFLPRWRLEDVMGSFAPVGGGVGPHFDYYDVFLLQASGQRRWRLGDRCNEHSALQPHPDIKLLSSFTTQEDHELGPGDMLYVPAGVAHWGESLSNDCVTLSVGFRAPSADALLQEAAELLAPHDAAHRYRDTLDGIDADPFLINAAARRAALAHVRHIDQQRLERAVAEALGRLVTDTRYTSLSDAAQTWTSEGIAAHVGTGSCAIQHQPHARLAYSDTHLFANGEAFELPMAFSQAVCHGQLQGPLSDAEGVCSAWLLNEDLIALD